MLYKLAPHSTSNNGEVFFNLRIHADFSWSLLHLGRCISLDTTLYLQHLPGRADSVSNVEAIVKKLHFSSVCVGNDDGGNFMDPSGGMIK